MNVTVIRDIALCTLVEVYRRFRGTSYQEGLRGATSHKTAIIFCFYLALYNSAINESKPTNLFLLKTFFWPLEFRINQLSLYIVY
jgi:hypothetical protein